MSKTETSAAGIKAACICPNIACFAVASSLCAENSLGGGDGNAEPVPLEVEQP